MVYSKWLYTSAIISVPRQDGVPAAGNAKADWTHLANAYAVGEKLIDIDFKDTVIDAFRAKIKSLDAGTVWEVAPEVVRIIYSSTPRDSPARRLIVDLYYGHGSLSDLTAGDDLPSDFLLELSRVGLSHIGKRPVSNARCEYHEHKTGLDNTCYIDRQAFALRFV